MKKQTENTQQSQNLITPRVTSEPSDGGTAQLKDNRTSTIDQRKLRATMKTATENSANPIQRKNNTGLPDSLKSGIENLSGYNMDDVKVHYNSSKPAQLQAHAYAQGTDIHLAQGQEKHLPHEAWHVVQQKQGRVKPTRQLKSKVGINDDAGLEKEADVMGAKAVQLHQTIFSANGLAKPDRLENGNITQRITIQRIGKKGGEKVAKLHIHADLDEPDMAIKNQLKTGDVGHAWISLEWNNTAAIPDDIPEPHQNLLRGGRNPIGFWPKIFDHYNDVDEEWLNLPDDERESYSSNPLKSYVAGQVVQPDNLHNPKATQSYDITYTQANSVMNYAESKRESRYSVYYYNCTTFAKGAAKAAGLSAPRMGWLSICYPDQLYKSIVKNQRKKKGTTTVEGTTVEGSVNKKNG